MKSRLFYNIARYLLAALFLFSGFAKSINPFGLSIQLGDYFSALGLPFLGPLAVAGAIVLPAMEFMLGIMLAAGIFRRFCAWMVAVFMGFFTILTLWIAIYNPVNDCGCFGDLLVISNWATFFKNVVFDIFVVVLFWGRGGELASRYRWVVASGAVVVSLILPIYSYSTLPIIDATEYKIGVNIPQKVAQSNTLDDNHTILIYKNLQTGKEREFEVEDTTWQDNSKWEFVDSRTTTLNTPQKRMLPLIAINANGVNVADSILKLPKVKLFIIPNLENISIYKRAEVLQSIRSAISEGNSAFILHSSIDAPKTDVEALTSDATMLKTMIQHHAGGVMTLHRGTIVDKQPL